MEEVEDKGAARLAEAVGLLDKSQHIKPAAKVSVSSSGRGVDVKKLTDLLKGSGEHLEIGKKIREVHRHKTPLKKPLDRRESEKIKRSTGYEEVKAKLDKWNAIVAKNRTAEFREFPLLDSEDRERRPLDEYVSKYTISSRLEKELEELNPNVPHEEKKYFPLTMAEMVEHRKEMAKIRAKQSYREAKARRQGKIKSKKYHRIQRKERIKTQLKEFEALQKTDPEEALKKLELLEKTRAEERVTLRHKSTGQWAKNKLVRAKYDKETRQQLAQQLAISRELTQKINIENGLESEDETQENPEEILADPMNPWMQNKPPSEYNEFVSGYKKFWEEHNKNLKQESEGDEETGGGVEKIESETIKAPEISDNNMEKREILSIDKKCTNKNDSGDKQVKSKKFNEKLKIINETVQLNKEINVKPKHNKSEKKLKNSKKVVSTMEWNVEPLSVDDAFDKFDAKLSDKVSQKLNKIKTSLSKNDRKMDKKNRKLNKNKRGGTDELADLSFKPTKIKPILDEELNEESGEGLRGTNAINKNTVNVIRQESENVQNKIDPGVFIAGKPKHLQTTLPDVELGEDHLDDDEGHDATDRQLTITAAFQDEDIFNDFREEKQKDIDENKPQVDDSFLPGWGSWTGKNLAVTKRKRKRFFTQNTPKVERKDDKKDDVIIREDKSEQLESHLVSELPFPFKSVKDFESTIRQPVGNTFIPETAHKKLTRPSTIVKTGVIIKPMSEDQLIDPRKKKLKFDNDKKITF